MSARLSEHKPSLAFSYLSFQNLFLLCWIWLKKKWFERVLKCISVEIVPVMEYSMGTGLELMIR